MKPGRVFLIAKKDLTGLAEERTILLAVALQVFIALFSSFLMIGLASLYDPSSLSRFGGYQYPIGYAGVDSPLAQSLNASHDFRVYPLDLSTGVAALKERKLAAVIYVSPVEADAEGPVTVTLYTLQNDIQSAIVQVKVRDLLVAYESQLRTVRESRLDEKPVPLSIPRVQGSGTFFEFIYGLLIPLLLLMPAILSAALVIDFITEEYQQETLETLLSTPVSFPEVIGGKVIAALILIPLQGAAWLALLSLNRIAIPPAGALAALIHATAFGLVLTLLGALTALHYRERTAAQFIFSTAVVVVILFSLAVPGNPMNLISLLVAGSAAPSHWFTLAATLFSAMVLAGAVWFMTTRRKDRVSSLPVN